MRLFDVDVRWQGDKIKAGQERNNSAVNARCRDTGCNIYIYTKRNGKLKLKIPYIRWERNRKAAQLQTQGQSLCRLWVNKASKFSIIILNQRDLRSLNHFSNELRAKGKTWNPLLNCTAALETKHKRLSVTTGRDYFFFLFVVFKRRCANLKKIKKIKSRAERL